MKIQNDEGLCDQPGWGRAVERCEGKGCDGSFGAYFRLQNDAATLIVSPFAWGHISLVSDS
jgi:hypothetical protein